MREGFVGTGRRVPRRDRRTVSGPPVRLSPSGGFTACGPRMDVAAIGIFPGVSGSIPSAGGYRRTQVASPSRRGPPRSVADLWRREARTAATGPRACPDPQRGPRARDMQVCWATERTTGARRAMRRRKLVENQQLARPSGQRGVGLSSPGLRSIAVTIERKVVKTPFVPTARRSRNRARHPDSR